MPHNRSSKPTSGGQRRQVKAGAVRQGTPSTDRSKLGIPVKKDTIKQQLTSVRGKLSD